MINKKLLLCSFRNIFGAGVYIFLVSQVISHGEMLFGKVDNKILAPFAFLLLFVLSAAVVGSLIFGRAFYYFFSGKQKESVQIAVYSIGWLFLLTVLVLSVLVIIK